MWPKKLIISLSHSHSTKCTKELGYWEKPGQGIVTAWSNKFEFWIWVWRPSTEARPTMSQTESNSSVMINKTEHQVWRHRFSSLKKLTCLNHRHNGDHYTHHWRLIIATVESYQKQGNVSYTRSYKKQLSSNY